MEVPWYIPVASKMRLDRRLKGLYLHATKSGIDLSLVGEIEELSSSSQVGLVSLKRLEGRGVWSELLEWVRANPAIRVVFLLDETPVSILKLLASDAVDILLWSEGRGLARALRAAPRRQDLAALRQDFNAMEWPLLIRASSHVLLERIPPQAASVPTTLTELVREAGGSLRTLERKKAESPIDLAGAIRLARISRAYWLHEEGASWSQVAVRLGYRTQSGLTELCRRGIGGGVGRLNEIGWEGVVKRLREKLCRVG